MNDEFPTYDDFKENKDKYDELKQLYLALQREKNAILVKELNKFISENAKLKEDYNKLVDENKMLTETLDKLRTKKPDNCENKWATLEEAEEFIDSLNPILSETPSVVINTKSINITFNNHTNNFKEDDTND